MSTSSRTGRIALPAAAIAVAVVVWWWVTDVLAAPRSMVAAFSPLRAVPALVGLTARGVLLSDVLTSLWRLLVGLAIGVVLGTAIGLAVGWWSSVELAPRPIVAVLRMISPLSWAPVAIGVFGIGHAPVFFLVAAAATWPIVLNTAGGVRALDPNLLLVARSLGADRREALATVVVPQLRPHLLTGLRLALGIAWVVLVPAEMLGVTSGLGYEILNARDQLAYDQVIAVILVIGVLGFLLDGLARRALDPRRPSAGRQDRTGSRGTAARSSRV